jgi:hypothetical protein
MSETVIGIKPWGTHKPKNQNFGPREDLPKIPYLRLNPGQNTIRIVSDPGTYYQARVKLPGCRNRKVGDRFRTAYPTHEDCPIKTTLGMAPKERYMAVVIDRRDNELKLFDMSVLVVEGVTNALEARNSKRKERGQEPLTPRDFDVIVTFNPKASSPQGWYAVTPDETEPMTADDLALVEDVGGEEVINKIIIRNTACLKPDTVRERLMEKGWDGNPISEKDQEEGEELEEPSEDDLSFNREAS